MSLYLHPDKLPQGMSEASMGLCREAYGLLARHRESMLDKAIDVPGDTPSSAEAPAAQPVSGLDEHLRSYLMQPHPAQVISILCFFDAVGNDENECPVIKKHFIQIGTGEGKSVTLAITSAILALLGFDVSCACYSDYLSQRDFRSFSAIFEAFSLQDNIKYGTFNQLAETFINARFLDGGGIRGAVRAVIDKPVAGTLDLVRAVSSGLSNVVAMGKKALRGISDLVSCKHNARPCVLLIDEVDVFFHKDFYGSLYAPLAKVADPVISALLGHIYTCRRNPKTLTLRSVLSSAVFQNCLSRFSSWKELLEEAVKGLSVYLTHLRHASDCPAFIQPCLLTSRHSSRMNTKL